MGLGEADLLEDDGRGDAGMSFAVAAISCSICLEAVKDKGDRSTAKLQCGHEFHLGTKFVLGKLLWKAVLYATCWKFWRERNNRVICNQSKSVKELTQSIIWMVFEWVSKRQEFVGVSLDDLNRSWDPFSKGRWLDKAVRKILWLSPPTGVLKLNFYGSYVHDNQQGEIGVIWDCEGKVIRNYSGHVDSVNANAVEVYALLIGCRELLSLGGYNAIIEGDSFSAIQWGSGKASHPWRLTDLVEEVQDIAKQLEASFHHVHREANVMADAFAKEGVLCSSILFDV